jgi:hypothetical protein
MSLEKQISSWLEYLVNLSAAQENGEQPRMSATCGLKPAAYLEQRGHDGSYSKMWLACSHRKTAEKTSTKDNSSDQYSVTWPRWGIVLDGVCMALPKLERHITGGESSLWPTPAAIDSGSGRINKSQSPGSQERPTLARMVKQELWSTPQASDVKVGRNQRGYTRNLHHQVISEDQKMWPSPAHRDYRSGTGAQKDTRQLAERVGDY